MCGCPLGDRQRERLCRLEAELSRPKPDAAALSEVRCRFLPDSTQASTASLSTASMVSRSLSAFHAILSTTLSTSGIRVEYS